MIEIYVKKTIPSFNLVKRIQIIESKLIKKMNSGYLYNFSGLN